MCNVRLPKIRVSLPLLNVSKIYREEIKREEKKRGEGREVGRKVEKEQENNLGKKGRGEKY